LGEESKKFGISVTLPENDPMAAPHLLGPDWVSTRWFSSPEERDAALAAMQEHPSYYRAGDTPSIVLVKVEA